MRLLKYFTPWDIFWSGGIEGFCPWAMFWSLGIKTFWTLSSLFMYNFHTKLIWNILIKKVRQENSYTKGFNAAILYNSDAHFYSPSVKIDSTSFFWSSDIEIFHHLLECYAIGISSSLIIFVFFKFNMPNKNAVLIKLKIKTIYLTKKLFWLNEKLTQYVEKKVSVNSY